jgi:GNAT superfamily N-acetyltransferase
VYAIYVREAVAGTGVGRAMFAAAEQALGTLGFDTGVLWVLEANERARRFYEAAGWRADGARATESFEALELPVVRYASRSSD